MGAFPAAVCHTAASSELPVSCGGQFHRRTKCKSPICPQSCRPQGVPALRLTGTGHALLCHFAWLPFPLRSRSPNARSEIKMNRFDGARRIGFEDLDNQIGYTHLLHYHSQFVGNYAPTPASSRSARRARGDTGRGPNASFHPSGVFDGCAINW